MKTLKMTKAQLERRPTNLRGLAEKWQLLDERQHLKYGERELVRIIDLLLISNYKRIEKAVSVYREMRASIEKLSSPSLWRFSSFKQAPPDYRQEYFRRMSKKKEEAMP